MKKVKIKKTLKRKKDVYNSSESNNKKRRKIIYNIPDVLSIEIPKKELGEYLNCIITKRNSYTNKMDTLTVVTFINSKVVLHSNFRRSRIPWITSPCTKREIKLDHHTERSVEVIKIKSFLFNEHSLMNIFIVYLFKRKLKTGENMLKKFDYIINVSDLKNNSYSMNLQKEEIVDFCLCFKFLFVSTRKSVKIFSIKSEKLVREGLVLIKEVSPFLPLLNKFKFLTKFFDSCEDNICSIDYFCLNRPNDNNDDNNNNNDDNNNNIIQNDGIVTGEQQDDDFISIDDVDNIDNINENINNFREIKDVNNSETLFTNNEKKLHELHELHENKMYYKNSDYIFIAGSKKFKFYNIKKDKFTNSFEVLKNKKFKYLTNIKKKLFLCDSETIIEFNLKNSNHKRILAHKNVTFGVYYNNWLFFSDKTNKLFIFNLVNMKCVHEKQILGDIKGIKIFNNKIFVINEST